MNQPTPTAYPLQWPAAWPKTDQLKREDGKFKQSIASALSNLKLEVDRLGGKNLILSSNYTLGVEQPRESGVAAYFVYDGANVAIPCDRWRRIEHNVQAIALTIEAMRGMDRWGAKHMIKAMFTGFKALPAAGESAWVTLGVPVGAARDVIEAAYRGKVKTAHPDAGGSHEAFIKLQAAFEELTQERA